MSGETIPIMSPGRLTGTQGPSEESIATEWRLIHGVDWRFDHGIGAWFHWNGARWERDVTRFAFHLIREHLGAVAKLDPKKAGGMARASVARGVEAFASADRQIAVSHDIWDREAFLLGTPAGVVDLHTGNIQPAQREAFITRSTSVAPSIGTPTRWLGFIDEVTNGNTELARFLQQALGYCLTGTTREHALFFAYGAGKNGKSVFLNTATRILGDYATTAAMDTFTASKSDRHPTDLARLDGARLVAASETEDNRAGGKPD
jgi:putative DNA primase/helicase